jgi:hypothetical protein
MDIKARARLNHLEERVRQLEIHTQLKRIIPTYERQEKSLKTKAFQYLASHQEPKTIAEISDHLLAEGYVTRSQRFRELVYRAMRDLTTSKMIQKVCRRTYQRIKVE